MAATKVALFADVESLHQKLRSLHHRTLDPASLLEAAAAHGQLCCAVAIAEWRSLPESLQAAFAEQEGLERVQVDRRTRGRERGGRRREVVRDLVDLELLAQMVEFLFADGGPEADLLVVATGDGVAARTIQLVRERFHKPVHVLGVEGAIEDDLTAAASSSEALAMPALEPTDMEGLEKLVPLLEDLERRKQYLNFKYIRESVVRRLDHVDRSFDDAERLLSEAIACGLLLKRKVEDKYKPGQLFTAYAIDRDHSLFTEFGSGEPAPAHEDRPAEKSEAKAKAKGPAIPAFAGSGKGGGAEDEGEGASGDEPQPKRKRRRRRRRAKGGDAASEPQAPAPDAVPAPTALSAGASNTKRKKSRKRGGGKHNQDRVGRSYEAPSRFIEDPEAKVRPDVRDDDIDEGRILEALQID